MQPRKFIRTYKTLLIYAGISVISVIGIIVAVIPMTQKFITGLDQLKALSSDVAVLRQKSGILQNIDEDKLRSNVQALSSAVPPDKSIPTVLSTIDGVSGQAGVNLGAVTIQRPGSLATDSAKKQTALESRIGSNLLSVSVSVEGGVDQIREFMKLIGAVRRYFRVQSFSLFYTASGASVNADITAFYLPYPAAIGGVGTPITDLSDKENATIARVLALPLVSSLSFAVGTPSGETTGRADPFTL